jgi:hypothetical protein
VPNVTGATTINTISINGNVGLITATYILNLLRNTCHSFGGKRTFEFDPHEIGNKSIRSGAAMALFINDVSTAKIMILGRWSSDAFLVYIRPQVLEWTNNMSRQMIAVDTFFDVQMNHHTTPPPKSQPNHYLQAHRSSWRLSALDCYSMAGTISGSFYIRAADSSMYSLRVGHGVGGSKVIQVSDLPLRCLTYDLQTRVRHGLPKPRDFSFEDPHHSKGTLFVSTMVNWFATLK